VNAMQSTVPPSLMSFPAAPVPVTVVTPRETDTKTVTGIRVLLLIFTRASLGRHHAGQPGCADRRGPVMGALNAAGGHDP
jgi:hypothetical protein